MGKPEYILKLEKEGKVFSFISLPTTNENIPKKIKDKKYTPVYSERELNNSGLIIIKKYILKSPQGFYIFFDYKISEESWHTTIYFEETQHLELQFFINNFLKIYKNATTNDNRA